MIMVLYLRSCCTNNEKLCPLVYREFWLAYLKIYYMRASCEGFLELNHREGGVVYDDNSAVGLQVNRTGSGAR